MTLATRRGQRRPDVADTSRGMSWTEERLRAIAGDATYGRMRAAAERVRLLPKGG